MRNIKILFRFMVWIVAVTAIRACSDREDYFGVPAFSGEGIPLSMCMEHTTTNLSDLQFGLYVFSRSAGSTGAYRLDSVIDPLTVSSRLKLGNAALVRKDYRFLFIATPGDHTSLKVVGSDRSAPYKARFGKISALFRRETVFPSIITIR